MGLTPIFATTEGGYPVPLVPRPSFSGRVFAPSIWPVSKHEEEKEKGRGGLFFLLRLSGAFSPFPLSFIQGPHGLSLSPLFFPPPSPCTVNLPDISGGHDIQSLRHWYHNTSGGGGGGGPSYSLSSFFPLSTHLRDTGGKKRKRRSGENICIFEGLGRPAQRGPRGKKGTVY